MAGATDTALGCFVLPDMIYKLFVGQNIAEGADAAIGCFVLAHGCFVLPNRT